MLKRIELLGFKSFADKTVLEFPAAITAIVGPNGSGKTNVVDGIRWVMGEESLKNIRLKESQDLIFSGTPKRPAMGLASVFLHFDNHRRIFPVEFSEVSIGRKLTRGGESEFFLNKSRARLKDIVQLLAGAKLGSRGITIITQGAGDLFLRSSPKERRNMLEEALGLKEVRLKKEDAERKMAETRANIEKTASLLAEILPHLRSLKRQYSRWERRKEKEEALRSLEETYFRLKLAEIERLGIEFEPELEKIKKEAENLRREIRDLEEELGREESFAPRQDEKQKEFSQNLRRLEEERSDLLRRLGKIEGQIEGAKAAVSGASPAAVSLLMEALQKTRKWLGQALSIEILEDLRREIGRILEMLEEVFSKVEIVPTELEKALEAEKEEMLSKLKNYENEINAARAALDKMLQEEDKRNRTLRELFAALEAKRRELRTKEELLREYELGAEKKKLKIEDLRQRLTEAGWNADDFFRQFSGKAEPSIEGTLEELESKVLKARRDLAEIGAIDEETIKEYEETEKRYQFLSGQKADLEKALGDLEKLAKDLEKRLQQDFSKGLKDISAEFQHYFRIIFGGGSARLSEEKLTNPNAARIKPEDTQITPEYSGPIRVDSGNIRPEFELETQTEFEAENKAPGIEISVDVPRKKIKSIEALSGGERALTSIALIFAIVGTSAPPLLVLDEIDAPLDETNSRRFAGLLKELSTKTQFIIITHNRATMEAADVLYGITMEEGISKIFSLKFEEAEKVAAEDVHISELTS